MCDPPYLEHFRAPSHVGRIDDPSRTAEVSNPACGDVVRLDLAIEGERVREARFQCRGCSAAIGVMSIVATWIEGRDVGELEHLTIEALELVVGELPRTKRHGLVLARDAVVNALRSAGER